MEATSSDVMSEVIALIHNWEEEHAQPNYDPVPTLTKYYAVDVKTIHRNESVLGWLK